MCSRRSWLGGALRRDAQGTWRLDETVTCAAVRLGATELAPTAAALRCDPWSHRRALGEAGLRGLIARVGLDGVARALGGVDATDGGLSALALTHPDAPTRRWAVDVARAESPWLVDALATLSSSSRRTAPPAPRDARRSGRDRRAPRRALPRRDGRDRRPRSRDARALATRPRGARRAQLERDARCGRAGLPRGARRRAPRGARRVSTGRTGNQPQWILEGLIELGLDPDVARETGLDEAPDAIVDAARAALVDAGFIVGGSHHRRGAAAGRGHLPRGARRRRGAPGVRARTLRDERRSSLAGRAERRWRHSDFA